MRGQSKGALGHADDMWKKNFRILISHRGGAAPLVEKLLCRVIAESIAQMMVIKISPQTGSGGSNNTNWIDMSSIRKYVAIGVRKFFKIQTWHN